MKRIVSSLVFLCLLLNLSAQEHLTFKGLPIDGDLSQFVNELKQQSYKLTYTNDAGNACVLNGTFAGYNNCDVFVLATENSHTVWKVVVKLPVQTSWYELKARYNDYKESLTQKYGTPTNDFHFFSKPYFEGDGYEFQALSKDKCTYAAYFDKKEGTIAISIDSKKYNSGCVTIGYEDKINSELRKNDQQKTMTDDL